jgi:hypothetical protein
MEKVILLGTESKLSFEATRGFYVFGAIVFGLLGIYNITADSLQPLRLIFGLAIIAWCLFQLFEVVTGFSENSYFAPKIRLTDQNIEFKTGFLKDVIKLNWTDIKSIDARAFEMHIQLTNTTQIIRYRTSYVISKEIKNAIIEYADTKGIRVL